MRGAWEQPARTGDGDLARHDQDGAVAVVVAILLIVLMTMAAFVVDFGMAYTNDRQLQTAADAAALGGLSVYDGQPGTCVALRADNGLRVAAHARAMALMADNHATATGPPVGTWAPTCTAGGRLSVAWTASDPVDTGLGGVVGVGEIGTSSSAVASYIGGAGSVSGLRPYAVCSSEIPAVLPSTAARVDFEGHSKGNECDGPPGNWRQMDCPINGSPPKPDPNKLDEATLNGCALDVSVVPDQEPPGDPDLRQTLIDACPPGGASDQDCLSGNTGSDFASKGVRDAWATLLGTEIYLPVVCGATACPGSTPPGQPAFVGNGTKSQMPVHKIVKATVCGYHWNKNPSGARASSSVAACAGSVYSPGGPADPATDTKDGSQYLVLVFDEVDGGSGPSSSGAAGTVALVE